ncbi:hypothetical protein [Mycobacterium sp. SMC-4]|uniref:hypothetical protein n=1 Tax=Mycobacterium sp. SMC-4 TaxID=2857059 RepID=UPI003D02BE3E
MTDYPRSEMARIQGRLNREAEAIRTSRRYSDTGKRIEMAKALKQARRERDQLKQSFLADRQSRRETLQRKLFGISGDATPEQLMIMRDSRDRAAKLDGPEDAATHLELATTSGDTYMAQAIAMVAATKGWNGVVNTYAQNAPAGTATALEELADIPSGSRTNLMDTAVFRLAEPDELRHYRTDTDLENLAAQDAEPIPAGGMRYEGVPTS